MKPSLFISLLAAALLSLSCRDITPDREAPSPVSVSIRPRESDTKVSYGGISGEKTIFGVGDRFSLFVFDGEGDAVRRNVCVYCSGLDSRGRSVWSVFREGSSEAISSNYPLAGLLSEGERVFACYPYRADLDEVSSVESMRAFLFSLTESLPAHQEDGFAECDLLVATDIEDIPYGSVYRSGREVRIEFSHVFSMLRFELPSGSAKYDYRFGGEDFTPCLTGKGEEKDEYRWIFRPGRILDLCVKYLHDGRLFRFETGVSALLYPTTALPGHSYTVTADAPKVPHEQGVDMGTSVMWAPFNLGAEDDPSATPETISLLRGGIYMWGTTDQTSSYGKAAYDSYNASFTGGVAPIDLPAGYDFTGDILYDAPRRIWRGAWRVPTSAEWTELFEACTFVASGRVITLTSKITGNSITLPFAGYYDGPSASAQTTGYYWSSTSNPTSDIKAYSTIFRTGTTRPAIHTTASRYTGLPIRPVYAN